MKKLLTCITGISLILTLLGGSIYSVSMSRNFYQYQYTKNATPVQTKMSMTDLMQVTDNLLNYIDHKRPTLDMTATIHGQVREVFDLREKSHMVDVKALFALLKMLTLGSFWVFILSLALGFFRFKKLYISLLSHDFWPVLGVTGVIVAALGALIFTNFDFFWTAFHKIAFTNDLWLLDPNTSVMINMFPLEFFYACCTGIIALFVGGIAVFAAALTFFKKIILK